VFLAFAERCACGRGFNNGLLNAERARIIRVRAGVDALGSCSVRLPEGDRYSLPYFLDPGMDTVIECVPTCTDPANPLTRPPLGGTPADKLMR
jgi:hypothetical protein